MDSSIFTFEDAFEDLLAVSQGQKLPDIKMKHDQRSLLRRIFPEGEPASYWVQRLMSQGLVDRNIDVPNLVTGLARAIDDDVGRIASLATRAMLPNRDTQGESPWDSFMDQFSATPDQVARRNDDSEEHFDAKASKREPDHFEEMFSQLQSAATNFGSTWDTWINSLSLSKDQRDAIAEAQNNPNNKFVKVETSTDEDGRITTRVTTSVRDSEGKLREKVLDEWSAQSERPTKPSSSL
jgi:hypothetical protein